MAITLAQPGEHSPIELDEFLEYVDKNVNPYDVDDFCRAADVFRHLLANRNFVADALNRALEHSNEPIAMEDFTTSIPIGRSRNGLYLRANLWSCPDDNMRSYEDEYAGYSMTHNHTFSFMTGGYLGRGYETVTFKFTGDPLNGVPGDAAHLDFIEKTALPTGAIMFYEHTTDVHYQLHPTDFSVSVNVIHQCPEVRQRTQYRFDVDNDVISAIEAGGYSESRYMVAEMAALVGNERTADLLVDLAKSHPHPHFRRLCLKSLLSLEPNRTSDVAAIVERDGHEHVRALAADLMTQA